MNRLINPGVDTPARLSLKADRLPRFNDVHTRDQPSTPVHTWLISLVFWLCLLLAAGLYACISLAPKLLSQATLLDQYRANQVRLVTLERRVRHLSKVGHALENEPAFAAELARIDFDAVRPGDERIPVDRALSLGADVGRSPTPTRQPAPWYMPLARLFAEHRHLRTAVLATAAFLALFSFTFMHDSEAPQMCAVSRTVRHGINRIARRYRRLA